MRRTIDAAPAAAVADAWGFRDASPPPSKETSDAVLLVLQEALLDTVGVLGIRLGAINIAWAEAVAGRRKKVWRVLKREPEKDFGKIGTTPGQLFKPHGVCSVPEGGVCVADDTSSASKERLEQGKGNNFWNQDLDLHLDLHMHLDWHLHWNLPLHLHLKLQHY